MKAELLMLLGAFGEIEEYKYNEAKLYSSKILDDHDKSDDHFDVFWIKYSTVFYAKYISIKKLNLLEWLK